MATKRKSAKATKDSNTFVRKVKNTTHSKSIRTRVSISEVYANSDNPESLAGQKFVKSGTQHPIVRAIAADGGISHFVMMSPEYDVIKAGLPSFKGMSKETRSTLLSMIRLMGNTASHIVSRILGLTARQIGAIRRWHVPTWRVLVAKRIK